MSLESKNASTIMMMATWISETRVEHDEPGTLPEKRIAACSLQVRLLTSRTGRLVMHEVPAVDC